MAKVVLDAGHGGSDPGAVFDGRLEKDDNLRLALAVGEILAQNGVDVEYTRVTDVYDSPVQKAQIANATGADYLISFHRNSSPTPNQYSGVETLVYDATGSKVTLAENINEQLAQVGFNNLGITERPNLAILRRSSMPAVLVEVGFINTEQDNALLDDSFSQVANGIAAGIYETITGTPIGGEAEEPSEGYYVQVGLYREYANASAMAYGLQTLGFPVGIASNGPFYAVLVGPVPNIDDGARLEQELQQLGYDTLLVTQ